jgi:voltage-gated potassium channel
MFLIEGPESGFTSIPKGVYWAIVTLTTVGYGDISPHTPVGQILASLVMIMGYGIIAVPTGIVTAELTYQTHRTASLLRCPSCGYLDHGRNARYCGSCGSKLESPG